MQSWFEDKRSTLSQQQLPKHSFKYGLTIRMRAPKLITQLQHSEQTITLEHENALVANLIDELDNPLVREYLFSTKSSEHTNIENFTQAKFDIGMLIIAPPGSKCEVDLTRTLQSSTFTEHVLIIAQENSELEIIDKYHGDECTQKLSSVEIIAQPSSKVRFAQMQYLKDAFDSSSFRCHVGRDASVDWFVASLGGGFTRAVTDSYMVGEGSKARIFGCFLGTHEEQFDILGSSWHKGSRSYSDMFCRGVLSGSSKGVYRGNIDIDAQAFGCNGYQTEETLLLSEQAIADAIPNLEIRNNDVACSHGATIGRLDDEKLFYLTSRGIPPKDAEQMVVEGFFEPVASKLDWPELFDMVLPLVREKLE